MTSHILPQQNLNPLGLRVLMRVDLNVPVQNGRVTDDTRLRHIVPSILDIANRGGRVVLLSHFGRPTGVPDTQNSLRPIVEALSAVLQRPVQFAPDCVGVKAEQAVAALQNGQILLLENVRFHKGEEANDPAFADALASLGDAYINDAFSVSHRKHASMYAVAQRLPSYAGLGTQAELNALDAVIHSPKRPVAAVVGGSKVSTKLALLNNLLAKVDVLMIAGAMANTFLAAQGICVGKSLYEPALLDTAKNILAQAAANGTEILLPVDVQVTTNLTTAADVATCAIDAIPSNSMAADVGTQTVALWARRLERINTVLWNGPLGAFEHAPFDRGTCDFATALARAAEQGCIVVAGGGDTAAAVAHAGTTEAFAHVSTAGGAFLECIEGCELPAIAVLRYSPQKKESQSLQEMHHES